MSHDTRAPTIMPLAIPTGSSSGHALAVSTNPSSVDNMPELPIVAEKEIKKTSASRVVCPSKSKVFTIRIVWIMQSC